jgi:hypothetical protein
MHPALDCANLPPIGDSRLRKDPMMHLRLPFVSVIRAALLAAALAPAGCAMMHPGLAPGQQFPVFFTDASVTPDARGNAVVQAAATWAHRYPDEIVTVTGYADPRAPQREAARLSLHRADAVAALLEADGVAPSRIHRATGDQALLGPNGLGNRRVDIAVTP